MKINKSRVRYLKNYKSKLVTTYKDVKIIYFYKKGVVLDCKCGKIKRKYDKRLNDEGYVVIGEKDGEIVEESNNFVEPIHSRLFQLKIERIYWYFLKCCFYWKCQGIDARVYLEKVNEAKVVISENEIKVDETSWCCISEKIWIERGGFYIDRAFSGGTPREIYLNAQKYHCRLKQGMSCLKVEKQGIKPGRYECVCDPDVTGFLVHEIVGHAAEQDMIDSERSKFRNLYGEKVASEIVNISDDPFMPKHVATFKIDDCGNIGEKTDIIVNGVFCNGIKNYRRESHQKRTYTRMSNTFLKPGTSCVKEMIGSIVDGYFLVNPDYGREDTENLYTYIVVKLAVRVKNGQFTGEFYKNVIISGDGLEIFRNITMISEKIELSGGGFCRKGESDSIKVSCGGPFIKTILEIR